MKNWRRIFLLFLFSLLLFTSCANNKEDISKSEIKQDELKKDINKEEPLEKDDDENIFIKSVEIKKDRPYFNLEEVVSYLLKEKSLPKNYLKKNQALNLGWDAKKGNLWDVTDKGVIGGDKFGNREGILPKKKGRQYFEADIDYSGGKRNAKRIVYSNDGLIYYTDDHYKSFRKVNVKD